MESITIAITALLNDPVVVKIGYFVVSAAIAVIVVRALQLVASRSIADSNARYRVRKFIGFFGYVIVALVLLSAFSEKMGQLSVIFGVAGAGIAFALQEVIASIAGWIAVSFGGFYRPGDRVQLGGIKGDVIDIGMLRTTLMEIGDWVGGDIYNGRIVRVANSFVFKEPVYNYSGEFKFLWDEFKLPVRMTSDWRLAQRLIEEAVTKNVDEFLEDARKNWKDLVGKFLIEEARVAPMVTVMITDNWYEFTARYVVNYQRRRITKDAIMRDLLIAFDNHRDKVEFGSTTIELVAVPKLSVK
ncbi:MAG: mechanosensitive ion channel family protein [Rhodospirillales bacterium]|nr:mechanosensitive ion channel family protein [Rhodospirillales bacterium]